MKFDRTTIIQLNHLLWLFELLTNQGLYCTRLIALRTTPLPLLVAEILKCFPDEILFITFVPVIRVSIPTAFPSFTKNGIAGRNRPPNPYAF
ncbi:hypothetical protein CDAR_586301 [Caerostris darwini]|uniref:Uncharacterized protein n=1 Tax=Caerostris darwini TaxID=1538125 RepID=A0AAV4QCY5_9ARAC|nr:hypothetical protein CDAR_586301 [Caerostris darwini]